MQEEKLCKNTLFPLLTSNEKIQMLQQSKSEAQCEFFTIKPHEFEKITQENLLECQRQQLKYLLKIQSDYITQYLPQKQPLQSAIKPCLEHQFEVIRANPDTQLDSKPIGLILSGPHINKLLILMSTQANQLPKFIQALTSLKIMQLGFSKNRYLSVRRIGQGSIAKVFESLDLLKNTKVAVRSFRKSKVCHNNHFKKSFLEEVSIMKELRSSSFPRLIAIYSSERSIYMVMELFSRHLAAHLMKFGFPEQSYCKFIMLKLAQTVRFLHGENIMHRDIKLQNIMFREDSSCRQQPVLIDFGIAVRGDTINSTQEVGTPGYIAPQIFKREGYTKKCDVFSLGVVFYYLLFGEMIFHGATAQQVRSLNSNAQINYDFPRQPPLPQEVRSLLAGMLESNPQLRLSAEQVAVHPFFSDVNDNI